MSHHKQLAAALLLVGASRHYGWLLVDPQFRGVASKALGSIAALCLLGVILWHVASKITVPVIAWYGFEELQTAMCSVMYLAKPWPVEVGQSMCSARIGFDIGTVGIFVVGFLAYLLVTEDGK